MSAVVTLVKKEEVILDLLLGHLMGFEAVDEGLADVLEVFGGSGGELEFAEVGEDG